MMKTASPTFELENSISDSYHYIAGLDEAGCGPLAGPVVAAAVIFLSRQLPDHLTALINDSKKLTEKKRTQAFKILSEESGNLLTFGIGCASVSEIDQLNIGRATRLAMERAVKSLDMAPNFALVDGIRKPNLTCPVMTVVKGDATSYSIAAASIIAKVTRDQIMQDLDSNYPAYGWRENSGYGTAFHLKAIQTQGITPHHRKSFEPIKSLTGKPVQLKMF